MVLLPDVVAGTEGEKVEYGKYVCITDRAVGFQTPENSTDRYAGTVLVSPERQKFFATIHKVLRVDTPSGHIKGWLYRALP
jgi:hypothetical protein